MKIIPRILLWIYALGVAVFCVVLLLQYAGVGVGLLGDRAFNSMSNNSAAVVIIFLLVSIFFLLYRTNGRTRREPQTVSHSFEHGDVKITYDTLEQLAMRAAQKIRGIQDLKTRVRANQETGQVRVGIQCAVDSELDIPKTSAELQSIVKASIENNAGIPVETVTVYVAQVTAPKDVVKKRVE